MTDTERKIFNSFERLDRELTRLESANSDGELLASWVIKCMRDTLGAEREIVEKALTT